MLTRAQQEEIVAEASRAPSVHNVQPARWRFHGETVSLLEDRSRRLPAGDPSGRDTAASLGAAFEGMRIALSTRGLSLSEPEHAGSAASERLALVCTARLTAGATSDELAPFVDRRRAWRGKFAPVDAATASALTAMAASRDDVIIGNSADDVHAASRLNDSCSWEFLSDSAYQAELYEWMRFSRDDPRWHRDGLTADCLAMSGVEQAAAKLLFKPSNFRILRMVGLGRPLVAEAARVKTSSAVVVLHRPEKEPAFESGRAFYRLWLELTSIGVVACPMSSIADSARGASDVRVRWGVPRGHRVMNVLRVGAAPSEPPRSARLPVSELLAAS
jgi:nitroreductase